MCKAQQKYNSILNNYLNGNKKDAAKAVKRLTKLQLVDMLVNSHIHCDHVLIGDSDKVYDFERFVLLALEGYHD